MLRHAYAVLVLATSTVACTSTKHLGVSHPRAGTKTALVACAVTGKIDLTEHSESYSVRSLTQEGAAALTEQLCPTVVAAIREQVPYTWVGEPSLGYFGNLYNSFSDDTTFKIRSPKPAAMKRRARKLGADAAILVEIVFQPSASDRGYIREVHVASFDVHGDREPVRDGDVIRSFADAHSVWRGTFGVDTGPGAAPPPDLPKLGVEVAALVKEHMNGGDR